MAIVGGRFQVPPATTTLYISKLKRPPCCHRILFNCAAKPSTVSTISCNSHEVNIKSYANNNELAVMPQDRVARLEWDRRYLSVLGVENNQLYELRLQTPEKSFAEEENDLRTIMVTFRVNKVGV